MCVCVCVCVRVYVCVVSLWRTRGSRRPHDQAECAGVDTYGDVVVQVVAQGHGIFAGRAAGRRRRVRTETDTMAWTA